MINMLMSVMHSLISPSNTVFHLSQLAGTRFISRAVPLPPRPPPGQYSIHFSRRRIESRPIRR